MFRSWMDYFSGKKPVAVAPKTMTSGSESSSDVVTPPPPPVLDNTSSSNEPTVPANADMLNNFFKALKEYDAKCYQLQTAVEKKLLEIKSHKPDGLIEVAKQESKIKSVLNEIESKIVSLFKMLTQSAHANLHDLIMKDVGPHIWQLCHQIEEEHAKQKNAKSEEEVWRSRIAVCELCEEILSQLRALIEKIENEIRCCLKTVDITVATAEQVANLLSMLIVHIPLQELEDILHIPGKEIECEFKQTYRKYLQAQIREEEKEAVDVLTEGLGEVLHVMEEEANRKEPSPLILNSVFATPKEAEENEPAATPRLGRTG